MATEGYNGIRKTKQRRVTELTEIDTHDDLHEWSWRMQGAREMLLAIIDSVNASKGRFCLDSAGKDSKVYHDAIVRLILYNLDNTQKFLMKKPIGYRNHVHDKKGRLTRCDAYF